MEKSLKKDIIINRLPVVIYFILIFAALMVIISAVAPMSNHEPKTTDTYSDFSTGWLNCEESEASLNHLSGTTVIHRTITAADCNKTLFFFAKTSNIKVFIDGVCQYRNHHFCSQFFGKTPGALFVNVLIPAKSDGKLLEIEIENPYKDDDSAKLDEMYIGDISDIIQFQQQKRFNSFCISFIIMVLGVVMLLLFIPLTRQKIVGIESWCYSICIRLISYNRRTISTACFWRCPYISCDSRNSPEAFYSTVFNIFKSDV